MVISNSNSKDISEIFRLYDLATAFQKLNSQKTNGQYLSKNLSVRKFLKIVNLN